MSKVTIESLYDDFAVPRTEAREYGVNYELYAKLAEIEVVPRKMVEMIIERIKVNKSVCVSDSYAEHTLDNVLQYSESLLKQFEEDINE